MKKVSIEINGKKVTKEIQDHTILSVFIRENLNLTGTHVGCEWIENYNDRRYC